MKQSVSFTEGPVGRQLTLMALPMVWGLLATMSFNAVDTFFVAQLGSDSLAAMSFTFPVVMLVTSMAIGLGAGTSSVMARRLGTGDVNGARQMAGDTLLLSFILSLGMMALGLATVEPLFLLLGAEPHLLPLISDYMTIWYLNTPFVIVPMVMSSMMRATGNNKFAGLLMLISALVNVVLDPLLIFGWGPIPRLEIAGAAWATVITRIGMTLASFYFVASKLNLMAWPHRQWAGLISSWRAVLHIGLPAMGTNMIIPLAGGITVALVASHGVDAVAGFGVAMRIEPVVLIAFYAVSGVIGPFLGQNMAVQYHARQQQLLSTVLKFSLVFGLILALLLWFSGRVVVSWFSDSEQVIDVAVAYLSIVPLSYGCAGLVMSVSAGFNGLGHPMPAMMISVLRVLGLYLPLALAGQWLWGLTGLFIATASCNVVMAILGYWWLSSYLGQVQAQLGFSD
ncbi:MATE family efflux transporter [Aestuariicella sp. G3-2]|uniref:MATE family efflux transporter n=1 Tax=Pseudomaricurvus albidus TaxID=2842452 RepID=UPI001C0AE8F6|nr:MATE family efflux transporter [Aestuariicella albida]